MKILWVGDPHVQKANLEESKRLCCFIYNLVATHRPDHVVWGGDLYNDFGTKRVEAEEFWCESLDLFPNSIAIEGNHDQTPDGSGSALTVHKDQCTVISRAVKWTEQVGFVPFIRDNQVFLDVCHGLYSQGARLIFCHADVNGAQYENGFYSPHGADISGLPGDLNLISGHIHKQQEFGNIWFPGTPRHLTRSDVGEQKGVWVIDTQTLARLFIPTPASVAEPFRSVVITPSTDSQDLPISSRLYVDVRGPKDFVMQTLKSLPEQAHVRTFIDTVAPTNQISESDGLPMAFSKYAIQYAGENQLDDQLAKAVLAKVYERCPKLRIQS